VPAKDVLAAMPSLETIVVNLYAYAVVNRSLYSDTRYFDALKPEAEGRFSAVDAGTSSLAFTNNKTTMPETADDPQIPTASTASPSSAPPTNRPPLQLIINIPEFIENIIDSADNSGEEGDTADAGDEGGTVALPELTENIIDTADDSGDDGNPTVMEPSSYSPTGGPTFEPILEPALFDDDSKSTNTANLFSAVGPIIESESTRRLRSWALVTTALSGLWAFSV
jgi:hypothetical protein